MCICFKISGLFSGVSVCAFQVQLLVSEQDVENYKQIKADLDQLRLTVEKSELWVEKSVVYSGEDLGVRQGKEPNMEVLFCRLIAKRLASKSEVNTSYLQLHGKLLCLC